MERISGRFLMERPLHAMTTTSPGKETVVYVVEHGWGTIGTLWQGLFSKGSSYKIFSQGTEQIWVHNQRHHGFCNPLLLLRRSAMEMALQHE
jgi:hypothetical protein